MPPDERRLRWGPPRPGLALHRRGVPPFGTTSCLYEGPWHIHVPLGTYPQGTASFANMQVVASLVKAGLARRRAATVEPSSHPRPSVFRLPSSVKAGAPRSFGRHARQPRDRSAAPNVPKDAVLPHWGASGTWMCRARELRQDAYVSDDPQCGRTAAPSGADASQRSCPRQSEEEPSYESQPCQGRSGSPRAMKSPLSSDSRRL